MTPRTTAIVFLVAAVLFAFIYIYEIRGGEARRESEESSKLLFPGLEAEQVEEIALITSDEQSARIVRSDGGWELREPMVFPGDEFSIDGMASALVDLKSEAVYEDPQSPDVYGLGGEEGQEVRFRAGGPERSIRIGAKTPMGSNTYVSIGDSDSVYTVPSFAVNAFRKALKDLRDKRVAPFDTNAVDRIAAEWRGGGRVVLERGEEGWRLVAPVEGPADETTVDSLLLDLSLLRAVDFEDDPLPEAEGGLDPPEYAVELTGEPEEEGGEPLRVSVAIGSADGETRPVRSAAKSLYRIPAERIDDFPRDLVAYRFKQLAEFRPTDAQRIEFLFQPLMSTQEGGEGPVEIVASRGDTGWTSSPERFRPGTLASLVSELARLRAENILAEEMGETELAGLGLSPPNIHISVYDEKEEPLARLRMGVVRGEQGIPAQVEGNPMVFELAYDIAERVPVSLEAFRNRFRSEEQPLEEAEEESPSAEEDLPPPAHGSP